MSVIGLGKREDFEPERARGRGRDRGQGGGRLKARSLAIAVPDEGEADAVAAALVEGAILATYRFDRFKSSDEEDEDGTSEDGAERPGEGKPKVESLTLLTGDDVAAAAEAARVAAEAANRARELQDLPSNVVTPSYLAERAQELAGEHEALSVEVMGRKEIVAKGMGGLEAVSKGSDEEPKLIALRYDPAREPGRGRAARPGRQGGHLRHRRHLDQASAGMQEMKMDMSGAAAVIEAIGAIAELELADQR